jgi:hypothetical protein
LEGTIGAEQLQTAARFALYLEMLRPIIKGLISAMSVRHIAESILDAEERFEGFENLMPFKVQNILLVSRASTILSSCAKMAGSTSC